MQHRDPPTNAVLVGFLAATCEHKALIVDLDVGGIKCNKLAAAQRTVEADGE